MTAARTRRPIDIYCRISKDPANDEAGVRRQEKQLRTMLKARGLTIGEVIVDNDKSASKKSKKKRVGYFKVCDRIRLGQSGGVAVYHSKRLLREPREMEDFIDLYEEHPGNVWLTLMSGDVDLSTATGRFQARLFAGLGALEIEEQSERIKAQKAEARSAGKFMGGQRPFGFTKDGKKHEPTEAAAYRDLFKRVCDGESLSAIARAWEAKGLLNRKGERYDTTSLRSLIAQKRAVGMKVDGTLGDWKPITTVEMQKRALAALRSRSTRPRVRATNTKRPAMLLSSLLTCGRCEKPLRAREGRLYKCDPNQSKGCGRKINAKSLETEVEMRLIALLRDPKTIKTVNQLRTKTPDVSGLSDRAQHLRAEIAGYTADAKAGDISRAQFKEIVGGLTAQLDKIEAQLDSMTAIPAISSDPNAVAEGWSGFDLDTRRRHLAAFVRTIRINDANGDKVFNPDRVVVEWAV